MVLGQPANSSTRIDTGRVTPRDRSRHCSRPVFGVQLNDRERLDSALRGFRRDAPTIRIVPLENCHPDHAEALTVFDLDGASPAVVLTQHRTSVYLTAPGDTGPHQDSLRALTKLSLRPAESRHQITEVIKKLRAAGQESPERSGTDQIDIAIRS